MQSTNIRQIKAALWEQAFSGGTQVRCPMGRVVAKRRAERPAPGDDPWLGALVRRFECDTNLRSKRHF